MCGRFLESVWKSPALRKQIEAAARTTERHPQNQSRRKPQRNWSSLFRRFQSSRSLRPWSSAWSICVRCSARRCVRPSISSTSSSIAPSAVDAPGASPHNMPTSPLTMPFAPAPYKCKPTLGRSFPRGYFLTRLPPTFATGVLRDARRPASAGVAEEAMDAASSPQLRTPRGAETAVGDPEPRRLLRDLVNVLVANWEMIRTHHLDARPATRPQVIKKSRRAVVPRYRYGEIPRLGARHRRSARYVLCADIAQFYPALYSHTIGWALHTATSGSLALGRTRSPAARGKIDGAIGM